MFEELPGHFVNDDFSFVFWDKLNGVLVMATCLFHKRSLLLSWSNESLCFSSCNVQEPLVDSCFEVPNDCWMAFSTDPDLGITGLIDIKMKASGCTPSSIRFSAPADE